MLILLSTHKEKERSLAWEFSHWTLGGAQRKLDCDALPREAHYQDEMFCGAWTHPVGIPGLHCGLIFELHIRAALFKDNVFFGVEESIDGPTLGI